uniref:G-protein coupled receptors family 1 profile domain-containing protein n=1 Tax=Leptobrachium leishanense TaxID=445787 RepID=A0A8C5QB32_9ANUR
MFATETPNKTDYKGGFVGNYEEERNITIKQRTSYLEHPMDYPNEDADSLDRDFEGNIVRCVCIFCIVIYVYIVIVGAVGNSLVIWIAGFKMKSVSAVWFLNLAITDIICNIALLVRVTEFTILVIHETLNVSEYLCKVSTCLIFFNMLTSVYFLTFISVDRCVCIMWPLWAKIHRTHRCAKIISIVIWMVCLIFAVPFVSVYNGIHDMPDCYFSYMFYFHFNSEQYASAHLTLAITKLIFMFVVPFFIILLSYGLILLKLATLKRVGQSQRPVKALKVITALVLCFFICWCPYNVWPLVSWKILLEDSQKYALVDFIITNMFTCFAYCNSCINPLVYVFYCQEFKEHLINAIITHLRNSLKNMSDEIYGEQHDRSGTIET